MKADPVLRTFAASLLAVSLGSCGSEAPSQPTTTTTAVSVAPTPSPTATPSPLGNRPVSAFANVFGYTRKEGSNQGRFSAPPIPTFQQADAIDIGCTPRDADGRNTNNHPDTVEWYGSNGGEGVLVEKFDYVWNEGDRYADQIEIRYLSRSGYIDFYCKIPGTNITSNTVRIFVFGGIR